MLSILLVFVFANCALGAILPLAQQTTLLDGRVVGGANADIISFPWQVSLQRRGEHSCGAIIYGKNIIITAAHCVSGSQTNIYSIRAGSSTWNSGGVVVQVAELKIHENYVSRSSENDIAVLRLEKALTFSSTIRPISLASQEPASGSAAVVTGWGTTYSGAIAIPTVLRYVNVKIIDSKQCASDAFLYGNQIKSNMICAAAPGKDSCQDDSGGPMVSGGVLVGVVSYGIGCADADYPGVYANVAVLKPWIENATEMLSDLLLNVAKD